MADFCKQCTEKHLGLPGVDNDFKGISTQADTDKGLYATVLCEGCGPIQVDHTGRCVSIGCFDGHNRKE